MASQRVKKNKKRRKLRLEESDSGKYYAPKLVICYLENMIEKLQHCAPR